MFDLNTFFSLHVSGNTLHFQGNWFCACRLSSPPDKGRLEMLRVWLEGWACERVWVGQRWWMCLAACCCLGRTHTPWRRRCRPAPRALRHHPLAHTWRQAEKNKKKLEFWPRHHFVQRRWQTHYKSRQQREVKANAAPLVQAGGHPPPCYGPRWRRWPLLSASCNWLTSSLATRHRRWYQTAASWTGLSV